MGTTRTIQKPAGESTLQIPLTAFSKVDLQEGLPVAADGTNPAYIVGTFGTDAPMIKGTDYASGTIDEDCYLSLTIPGDYNAGGKFNLSINAGMLAHVSDDDANLDVEAYESDDEGSVGADLCDTAAQSINLVAHADYVFVIDPPTLAPGDILFIKINLEGTDAGSGDVIQMSIGAVKLIYDRR